MASPGADAVSLDFPQLLTNYQTDPGHVSRLFVHEVTPRVLA